MDDDASTECARIADHFIDYHHGDLAPDLMQHVAAHLPSCASCARAFCRLQAELRGVAQLHGLEPRAQVLARLRERVARRFRVPWWQRLLLVSRRPIPLYQAVVAVALLVIMAWALVARERFAERWPASRDLPSRRAIVTTYDAAPLLIIDEHVL